MAEENKEKESKEIVEEIEDGGVSKDIAEKEEKLDEESMKESEIEEDNLKGEKLEKAAEKESTDTETSQDSSQSQESIEDKKKALQERAKKLSEQLKETKTEELKEEVKEKKTEMLIPLEEYVKSGIYIGTKVVTPDMRPFVYRRRADGLAIFNTDLIDVKIKEARDYLSKFNPKDVILVCKRQAGWKAAEKFSEVTGIRVFTKKYPAGILTNSTLPNFFENELTIITDAWLDKNALNDTLRVNKKVLMICDTNNFSKGADKVLIGNNKSAKSLGLIFYLLAKGYCEAQGLTTENIPELEWWVGEKEDVEQEAKKKAKLRGGAKYGV